MAEQIFIGNFSKGLTTNRLPYNIDNDAFPTMINFYSWRGRAKRKRGTALLGRVQIQIIFVASVTEPWQTLQIAFTNGVTNILTSLGAPTGAAIVPGTVNVTIDAVNYVDTNKDGLLYSAGPTLAGVINYATSVITLTPTVAPGFLTGTLSYYPDLPILGLEDLVDSVDTQNFPLLMAFDQEYSYQFNESNKQFYNTTFFKESNVPFVWSGQDYQQFWTTNYHGAFWASNNKPGLNILQGAYVPGSPGLTQTFTFTSLTIPFPDLVIGDVLWFNEWTSTGTGGPTTLNNITGVVSNIAGAGTGTYVVTFASSVTVSSTSTGIVQLLTNSIPGQDGIKWYDGDPTGTTGLPTTTHLGWVNFAPPLTGATTSIDNTPERLYYLVGAQNVVNFKDRMLFFSPWIQSSTSAPIQLTDSVIWSWNGTPYYTVDSLGSGSLIPTDQTADVRAYYTDQIGFGGWISSGLDIPIATVSPNEDVLLVGFGGKGRKTRFVYTGDDLQPFLFYNINAELPSSATYSSIPLDVGVVDLGPYGIAMTDQQSSQRVDLSIPDSIFQVSQLNFAAQRISAARDFQKEWIYFSYSPNDSSWNYPTQTFLFNYRESTWAILYENFTCHGTYRSRTGLTWDTVGAIFPTWDDWNESWNSSTVTAEFPVVVGGNPQGYVLRKAEGTGEAPSGYISNITQIDASTNPPGSIFEITSYNHCVAGDNPLTGNSDYLYFTGLLGMTTINGLIGSVIDVGTTTTNANVFRVYFNQNIPFTGTYLGGGQFSRLSQPILQTKQFAPYWDKGRKMRIGTQQYLLDTTSDAQATVYLSLGQDPITAWNDSTIVPNQDPPPVNNSLVYSNILYTCPEGENLGLTPANTNLQQNLVSQGTTRQKQMWHRFNTSLIGDSVQIGITLNDAQMRSFNYSTAELSLHGIQITAFEGPLLS